MKKLMLIALVMLIAGTTQAQATHTLWMRANPSNAQFRFFLNGTPTVNSGGESMVIADWTSGGTPYNWRSLLKFDLSSIPATAIIDSASLSLWANPTSASGNVGNPTWGTDNAVGIYWVVDAWDTNTVSWDVQPGFGYSNADTLPQSTSYSQDYLNTDVTNVLQDMFEHGIWEGFMLKHTQETTPLNSMIFYSPYESATDTGLAPLLVVHYRYSPTAVESVNNTVAAMELYPNPATTAVNIQVAKQPATQLTVTVTDCVGRTITTMHITETTAQATISLSVNDYAKGVYIVRLSGADGNTVTKKLVVE